MTFIKNSIRITGCCFALFMYAFRSVFCGFLFREIVGVDRLSKNHKPLEGKFRRKIQDHIDRRDEVFIPAELRRQIVL